MAGDYTEEIFDKAKNYLFSLMQRGKPVLDSDRNDGAECLYWLVRDLASTLGLAGFAGDGFKLAADPADPENNFAITSGYGYSNGHRMYHSVTCGAKLTSPPAVYNRNLSSVLSSVAATTASDDRMNFSTNELAGREMLVLRSSDGALLTYTVSSNTASTITLQPTDDLVADGVTRGCSYYVVPSTPAGARTDLVCLNTFLDEVDSDEDDDLLHSLAGGLEFDLRKKLRYVVRVVEDVDPASPESDLPADYVDFLGNSHTHVFLGSISRSAGVAEVDASDLSDGRETLHDLGDFVKVAGDVMEGDLGFSSNRAYGDVGEIDFSTGTVSGMTRVSSEEYRFPSSGQTLVLYAYSEAALSSRFVAAAQATGELANVAGAWPLKANDFATKNYVDNGMSTHSHPEYATREAVEAMSARIGESDLAALIFSVHGRDYLAPSEHVDWDHDLGSDFLFVQCFMKPTTGAYSGMWMDAIGSIHWATVSTNTIRLYNLSSSNLDGNNLRVAAMLSQINLVLNVTDARPASSRDDDTEGLVSS